MWKPFIVHVRLHYGLHLRIPDWGFKAMRCLGAIKPRVCHMGECNKEESNSCIQEGNGTSPCEHNWQTIVLIIHKDIAHAWVIQPSISQVTYTSQQGQAFSLVSKLEWKLCWSPSRQLKNGSCHQFILEVRSFLPLGEIIRWSRFTPDTFKVSYSFWDNSRAMLSAFGKKTFSTSYWLTPHRGVLFKVHVGLETQSQ